MSLPKLRPVLGDRRDVRASLQFAEQNLLKQKSFIDADLKKRQVELQRNERILKKSFGNLTKTTNLGVVQTNQKDIRGGQGAAGESNRNVKLNRDHGALTMGTSQRLGRRHSMHSDDRLTSELSHLGIGPSALNRTVGRKHGRRGSVDANIPSSRDRGAPSVGVETNKIDESSLIKQSDGGRIIESKRRPVIVDDDDTFSEKTNENLIRNCKERNAVFVFKYEEDDSKVQTEQQRVKSCFAIDKTQETNRENDGIKSINEASKPKSALSRSRSQRKKLRVKIMSPVQEYNQSTVLKAAESDSQVDSGISEESENSSCGTRSLYSDSYDSLSRASESDWSHEETSTINTSHQAKLSIDVNSNHLLKPLKKNRCDAASDKVQSLDRIAIDSSTSQASNVASAQISGETRGPTKASLSRRRRSIAAAEGISSYRQDQTHSMTNGDTELLDNSESSLLGSSSKTTYFLGRRGSMSIVGESPPQDSGDVRPSLLTIGRQEGIRQVLPATKVKAHHKPSSESNRYVQKTVERAAAWEAVRRTRYLPGYEPNTH